MATPAWLQSWANTGVIPNAAPAVESQYQEAPGASSSLPSSNNNSTPSSPPSHVQIEHKHLEPQSSSNGDSPSLPSLSHTSSLRPELVSAPLPRVPERLAFATPQSSIGSFNASAAAAGPFQDSLSHAVDDQEKYLQTLAFLSETELNELIIGSPELRLSEEEREYLYLRRRRMSIERSLDRPEVAARYRPRAEKGSVDVKVMVLGDEDFSSLADVLQLYTLPDLVHRFPELLDFVNLPPCDIQRKSIDIRLEDVQPQQPGSPSSFQYGRGNVRPSSAAGSSPSVPEAKIKCNLELWAPYCTEQYKQLREEYFQATDVFVLVFSVRNRASLDLITNEKGLMSEVRRFMEKQSNKEIPVVLVGNHVESRSDESASAYPGAIVSPQEAIAVAQELGISKYIEIFSNNLTHTQEIFKQTAIVSLRARERNLTNALANSGLRLDNAMVASTAASQLSEEYDRDREVQDHIARQYLTVPMPVGIFDYFNKSFSIDVQPDVVYLLTLDGTEPTRISSRYTGPIRFKKPYPKEIKVVGYSRAKFCSEIATFAVPEETSRPEGYFDIVGKKFFPVMAAGTSPSCMFFYTSNGTKPSESSLSVSTSGVSLDSELPLAAFGADAKIPATLKIVALEPGKFRSSVIDFRPFECIPQPLARYNEHDSMLYIETLPGYEYRYTLDGSTPTYFSYQYTGPIMLPKDPNQRSIKVAAFPKLIFPSRVLEIRKNAPLPQPKQGAVKMTKSALGRQISPQRVPSSSSSSVNASSSSILTSPRSKSPSPATSSEIPVIRPLRGVKAPPTKEEQMASIRSKSLTQFYAHPSSSPASSSLASSRKPLAASNLSSPAPSRIPLPASASRSYDDAQEVVGALARSHLSSPRVPIPVSAPPQQQQQQQPQQSQQQQPTMFEPEFELDSSLLPNQKDVILSPEYMSSCRVEGNTIEFQFEYPVLLSKIGVSTPGQNRGPGDYSISCVSEADGQNNVVGEGSLDDVAGTQEIRLKTSGSEYRCLRCTFKPRNGSQTFSISDLQLFAAIKANQLRVA